MTLKQKVFAYITHGDKLLVFEHLNSPEANIQVPAGTLHEDENLQKGVLREAFEETGLKHLKVVSFLGRYDHPVAERGEIHRRHFFHLVCEDKPPSRWQHDETDPSEGVERRIPFDLYWVSLPDGVPVLAPGHARMLPRLLGQMDMSS